MMEEYRKLLDERLKDAIKIQEGLSAVDGAIYKGLEIAYEHALKMVDLYLERENHLK